MRTELLAVEGRVVGTVFSVVPKELRELCLDRNYGQLGRNMVDSGA